MSLIDNQSEATPDAYMVDPLFNMMMDMLTTQDALNQKFVGADWKQVAGKRERVNYACAILEEATELQASDPSWKWWKSNPATPDLNNMKIELVDLLHFAMSDAMADSVNSLDENEMFSVACNMAEGYIKAFNFQSGSYGYMPQASLPAVLGNREYNPTKVRYALHSLAASAMHGVSSISVGIESTDEDIELLTVEEDFTETPNEFLTTSAINWTAFWSVAYHAGFGLPEVYGTYMGKAVLNSFRIANGDKAGEYHRNWTDGKQDNEVLSAYYDVFFQEHKRFPTLEQTTEHLTVTYAAFKEALHMQEAYDLGIAAA